MAGVMKPHWPKVRVTGGPHAKNTVVEVDGEKLRAVHRVDIHFDVNDAVKLDVASYAEHVEVEVEGIISHRVYIKDQELEPVFDEDGETSSAPTRDDSLVRSYIRYSAEGPTFLRALERLVDMVRAEGDDPRSPTSIEA